MTISEVMDILDREAVDLKPTHRAVLQAIRVKPYKVPVESDPGETVVVVAEYRGAVLYWSDIEEGWEFEPLSPQGAISQRGSNQYLLAHVMHQVFGPGEQV
ncbi:MAG: hypothetical protein IT365_15915 [Candidatus Hydrogenedentes bacterium]|nr:hypothetical protein [Candidatus Hydrogenedentota bacterium]